jgi:HlyD family secretion protein
LQSATTDNVVNYTVIVTLENPEGKLLPGMTARVDFLVQSAENVLKVPNAALRYKPSDELLARLGAAPAARAAKPKTATSSVPRVRGGGDGAHAARTSDSVAAGGGNGTLYSLDAKGALQAARVRTGISDGLFTELLGENVPEGTKVIDGIASTSQAPAATPTNPMSGNQPRRPGPPGGF